MTTEMSELGETVMSLAAKKYPEIAKGLIAEVLRIEEECSEHRDEAAKRVGEAIERYVLAMEIL